MSLKTRFPIINLILLTVSALLIGVLVGRFVLFGKNGIDFDIIPGKEKDLSQLSAFSDLAEKLMPSVVNISTRSLKDDDQLGKNEYLKKFFKYFFKAPRPIPPGYDDDGQNIPEAMSLGSGFIISEDGLILTDNHVTEGADEIWVSFANKNEKSIQAKLVGEDPELDLALLKIESKLKSKWTPVEFGDSEKLKVGEYVLAIGNPFGRGHTVTHGIISAKGRDAPDFPLARYLQTDAPINPGNSGGPIVNIKGQVVGIANAIDARAQGIGFAIPINLVKKVLPELKTKGTVARGYIGILVNELTADVAKQIGVPKDLKAPFVAHVYPNEPAAKAGIKPYDVILEFDGKKIKNAGDLIRSVAEIEIGKSVKIRIQRGSKKITQKIKIEKRPVNLETAQSVKRAKEPVYTGLILEDSSRGEGVVISEILESGPAESSGLQAGDLILEVNRKKINSRKQFYSIVKKKRTYLLRVLRQHSASDRFLVLVLNLSNKN